MPAETAKQPPDNEKEPIDVLELSEVEETSEHFDEELPLPPSRHAWIVPTIALLTIAAWTGLYAWAMRGELLTAASKSPSQWVSWIVDWSVPVLLVCVIWLLAMRNSHREANRFATTANMLSQESAQLEGRLTIVNRELSLAREFLASQSRDLESLGRVASERISEHAVTLQDLIKKNDKQVRNIGQASDTALENMVRLRDDLPVIANSARDVSNQIGNAGRTAQEQADTLINQFKTLTDFSAKSDEQITAMTSQVGQTLDEFDTEISRLESDISQRFDQLQTKAAEYRIEVDQAEAEAFASLSGRFAGLQSETDTLLARLGDAQTSAEGRQAEALKALEKNFTDLFDKVDALDRNAVEAAKVRVESLHDEAARFDELLGARDIRFIGEMQNRQAQFEEREARGSEIMSQRLVALDKAMMEQRELHASETEKLSEQSAELSEQFEKMGALVKKISDQGDITRQGLTEGLADLGKQLSDKRLALGRTAEALGEINNAALKMLDNIEIGIHHTREELPQAITTASDELNGVVERASELKGVMLATSKQSEELSAYLTTANKEIERADNSINALQSQIFENAEDALVKVQGLRSGLAQVAKDSEFFAGETQESLRQAISKLEGSAQAALVALDESATNRVSAIATDLSAKAVEQLSSSLREESEAALNKIENAANQASGIGRDVTAQLRDQLDKVNELTGNLEQRVARARELAEEEVSNDFTRRVALITDSLNSGAIDIASALSGEVSDTEWSAYLKGDRGIFTRRAVRLLNNAQAKEISELYKADEDFNANVNRYIHDFESMMRSMLSTRDGNALGVTVLGSDMGKLYVALAQGIERLRN